MNRNRSNINIELVIILTALFLLTIIVISVNLRSLLPWSYLFPTIFIGALLSTLILTGKTKSSLFLIIVMGLILWNVNNLAMNFSMIPFYDSYSEYIFARVILENGHFQLNMYWPSLYPSPTDPSSYPLFSVLTVILASTMDMDLLHIALLMTIVNGLTALLFTLLFVKFFSNNNPQRNIILLMALLFFVTSPDAIYNAMLFYHRHFSLALGFIMMYLLAKRFCLGNADVKSTTLLAFFILILPLSYSYYPVVYTVFLFWLTILSFLIKSFRNIKSSTLSSLFLLFLIMFTCGFIWYFNITFPNTFTKALEWYISQLSNPTISSFEIERSSNTTAVLPQSLTLTPLNKLLQVRDVIMFSPMFIYIPLLLYNLLIKGQKDIKKAFLLLSTASFTPIVITSFIATGWGALEWRYYMMPIIIYFAANFYSSLLQKRRGGKQLTSILIVFLVVLSFTSLYSHLYFPRYLYDPSLRIDEVGQPSPTYIILKGFLTSYLPENKHIISDDIYLLYILLPYEKYEQVGDQRYFGESNTIFVELTDLRNPRTAVVMFNQSDLLAKFYKVLDSGPYAIYYNS